MLTYNPTTPVDESIPFADLPVEARVARVPTPALRWGTGVIPRWHFIVLGLQDPGQDVLSTSVDTRHELFLTEEEHNTLLLYVLQIWQATKFGVPPEEVAASFTEALTKGYINPYPAMLDFEANKIWFQNHPQNHNTEDLFSEMCRKYCSMVYESPERKPPIDVEACVSHLQERVGRIQNKLNIIQEGLAQ